MEFSFIALVLVLVVLAVAAWAYFTATRLNRLHIRVDSALAALEAALDRRAAVAAALDVRLEVPARAAEESHIVQGHFAARSLKERELAQAMKHAFVSYPPRLVEADTRVRIAHRFYNEAVADTRALRLRPAVRVLRLGGTAPLPEFFELSDLREQAQA
ncbi:hypothetical protein G7Y31_06510 [Corynebacterium lizhenjunii]|uniref:NUDIX hydrolase n=1 Tax=Corynebacterium lizhenjunii TaxID=2709394 RepID=A0A7T0KEJ3_9CORY|nr:hypothetical protein [Corynebacterium lizhenjunii]QPK78243.1 hypothetical protein G7Y31_06510 [Corynebacterium lizhenjunii]